MNNKPILSIRYNASNVDVPTYTIMIVFFVIFPIFLMLQIGTETTEAIIINSILIFIACLLAMILFPYRKGIFDFFDENVIFNPESAFPSSKYDIKYSKISQIYYNKNTKCIHLFTDDIEKHFNIQEIETPFKTELIISLEKVDDKICKDMLDIFIKNNVPTTLITGIFQKKIIE